MTRSYIRGLDQRDDLRWPSEKSRLEWSAFLSSCSLPAVFSAPSLQPLIKASRPGVSMFSAHRPKSFVASFGLVIGLAAASSAQAPSSNGKAEPQTIQSIRIKVIGCVAGGTEAGRYLLTDAFLSGDDIPST